MDKNAIKILVSACLIGQKVRYDGGHCQKAQALWQGWEKEGRLIPICPEVAGGLSVPRPPAEIEKGDGAGVLTGNRHVVTKTGLRVTEFFLRGAHLALELAKVHQLKMAILKEKSPSCGTLSTYDGSFSRQLTHSAGVTAALLQSQGVRVFSDTRLDEAAAYLAYLESLV